MTPRSGWARGETYPRPTNLWIAPMLCILACAVRMARCNCQSCRELRIAFERGKPYVGQWTIRDICRLTVHRQKL